MDGDNDVVVVVEDEEEARTALTRILEFEGFKAIGFSNGAEALEYLVKSEEPCLIVLDIRMPVMDGPQLRVAMLRDPRLANIPVVVVTAMDPSAAAVAAPASAFRQPLDVHTLLVRVL